MTEICWIATKSCFWQNKRNMLIHRRRKKWRLFLGKKELRKVDWIQTQRMKVVGKIFACFVIPQIANKKGGKMFWQNLWKIVCMFQLKVTKRFCLLLPFFFRPPQIQLSKVKHNCEQYSHSSPLPKSVFECFCSNRLYLFWFFRKQN